MYAKKRINCVVQLLSVLNFQGENMEKILKLYWRGLLWCSVADTLLPKQGAQV